MDDNKKMDCPAAKQEQSKEETNTLSDSISRRKANVKSNPLRDLRIEANIQQKEIVDVVRELFPKYDKMLLSKCEHTDDYGITIRKEALDALIKRFAPEKLEAIKKKRRGGHKLQKCIACRLADDEYEQLIKYTHEDGFDEMQAWLTYVVRHYLKSKAGKEKDGNGI